MGGLGAWLRDVCSPYESTDRRISEAASTLHVILLGGLVVAFGFTVSAPLLHKNPWPAIASFASMFVAHAFGLWLVKRGHVRPVAIVMSCFMFVFVTFMAYRFGGLSGVGVFVYPSVVIFAGLTWRASAAVGIAIAASLAALLMGYLGQQPLHEAITPPSPLRVWATLTGVVTIISVMLLVALRSMRRAEARERALNDQLQDAQRLEALGRLAGGVAHDFNNLLTVILLHTSLLKMESKADVESFQPIENAALRAAEMTQQLLALGRRQSMLAKVVDVNDTLRETEKLVQALLPASMQFRVSYGALVGRTKMDPAGLERVVINLVINARDAMKSGGTIDVSSDACNVDSEQARTWKIAPGRYARVSVRDTGPGISDTIRLRLFEPFATTKAGQGTGLGLASVRGIVTQSGGVVNVISEVGKGACFEVLLPLSDEATSERIATALSPTPAPIRVLLLDDDATVRAATRTMLEAAGYTVREAETVAHERDDNLKQTDLVVTDTHDRDPASFDQMRVRHPRLRVAIVRKPFTRDQLLETLQRTLNAA